MSHSDYKNGFKIFTDSAALMSKVFVASIYSLLVSYSHWWTAGTSHILNTCIRNDLKTKDITNISKNLTLVKSIVSPVKHASVKDDLEDRFHLFSEIILRFCSTYDMVERFNKFESSLRCNFKIIKINEGTPNECAIRWPQRKPSSSSNY